jgi:hypothetical protein
VHACICTHIYMYVYVCMHIWCMWVNLCLGRALHVVYLSMYVCMHVSVSVRMYVCVSLDSDRRCRRRVAVVGYAICAA